MTLVSIDDPRIKEISKEWVQFLRDHENDFPERATATSIGQVLYYLLAIYQPPTDEIIPVLETSLTLYISQQESGSYKEKMN